MEDTALTAQEVWQLYAKKEIEQAVKAANEELTGSPDPASRGLLYATLAWCAYYRKQYTEVLVFVALAENYVKALECEVTLRCYVDEYKDDARVMELVEILGANIAACNALIILAGKPDSNVGHDQIKAMAEKFATSADVARHDVSVANVLQNCAKFFREKMRNISDLILAVGLMKIALAHYGDVINWNHRAAAMFWLSKIYEDLGAIPDALKAAVASLCFWQCQLQLEKDTAPFKERLENARNRIIELSAKMVEFTLRSGVKATK